MDRKEIYWLFMKVIVPALLWMLRAAAAESPALTCTPQKDPDGYVSYMLSEPTPSHCTKGWEDVNKTAITQDSDIDKSRVHAHDNQSITMNECQDYLHFQRTCFGVWEEAHCNVTCSRLLMDVDPTRTVNHTKICILETWCPDQTGVGLCITGILVVAAIICVSLFLWRRFKPRRGQAATVTTTSYTPVNDQIKIEIQRGV